MCLPIDANEKIMPLVRVAAAQLFSEKKIFAARGNFLGKLFSLLAEKEILRKDRDSPGRAARVSMQGGSPATALTCPVAHIPRNLNSHSFS